MERRRYPGEAGAQRALSNHVPGPAGDGGRFRTYQAPTRLLMNKTIHLGEIPILVTRKAIKHVHLSVHPPTGRVTLVAPVSTPLDVARAYAISRLGWIREQ